MRPATWSARAAVMLLATLAATVAAAPSAPTPAAAPPGSRTLYLVRHGWYDSHDPADPRVGRHLDALGREQARLVARRLRALPVRFATVRTSTLTRAMETGDLIGRALGVPVTRDSLLNECTPPTPRAGIRWDSPGEADSAQAQMEAAWAAYARPSPSGDTHEVLACHGNVIRWFAARAIGADTGRWAWMDIANASLTIITIKPDGAARLVVFSEVGHLPLARQTWAGRGPGWAPPTPAQPRMGR